MTQATSRTIHEAEPPKAPPVRTAADQADFKRRLRVAGLDPDGPLPEDQDEFRLELARRIHMFVNTWHGCPERLCRRQRGCMAPSGACANTPVREPTPEEWSKVALEIRTALTKVFADAGVSPDDY